MKPDFPRLVLFILALCCTSSASPAQVKSGQDTLYEQLKKRDINKMTQREYEYFMLMKRKEVQSQGASVIEHGILTGVVTYFFNDNYGDKPDVGSEIFILPEKYKDTCLQLLRFQSEVLSRTTAELSRELGHEYPHQKMSQSDFEQLETHVSLFIEELKYDKLSDVNKVLANGNGSFSIYLTPGKYYLIARSAHRKSYSNKVEMYGQIDMAIGQVKAGQTTFAKLRPPSR